MKRSKFIDLNRMRKSKAGLFALAPLAMAVMAGCSDSAQAEKELAPVPSELGVQLVVGDEVLKGVDGAAGNAALQ